VRQRSTDRVEKLIAANPGPLYDVQESRLAYRAVCLQLDARRAMLEEARERLSRVVALEKSKAVAAEEVRSAKTQASKGRGRGGRTATRTDEGGQGLGRVSSVSGSTVAAAGNRGGAGRW